MLATSLATAQDTTVPMVGEATKSMGLPHTWRPHAGAFLAWDQRDSYNGIGPDVTVGVYRDLGNPVFSAIGATGEAYYRYVTLSDGGLRLFLSSRFFNLHAGADYSFRENDVDFLLSITGSPRRSGIFGRGGHLRIDWYPARNHSFNFGFTVPIFQPYAGKTRPKHTVVKLPEARSFDPASFTPSAELQAALTNVGHTVHWINRFTTPYFDQGGNRTEMITEFTSLMRELLEHMDRRDALFPDGHVFGSEIRVYHAELEKAFSIALGASEASDTAQVRSVATRAKQILLDEVILRYNRLLGQRKKRDSLMGFRDGALRIFEEWLESEPALVPSPNRVAVIYVFKALIDAMEENRKISRDRWGDSREVWIPLHLALHPEEVDTQEELNAILEKATKSSFSHENQAFYVIDQQFHIELARSILAAEDYHVLWIHDFAGLNDEKNPDTIGYWISVEAYLAALTRRVREYDTTRKIPTYIVLLDQFFFQFTQGARWMRLLENPLEHELDLPKEHDDLEVRIRRAQDSLRTAVAESKGLQAGTQAYGQKWLDNQIKVHVNITNPADLTFRSAYLVRGFPFAPDVLMRDHRKIAFYDVTELDPGRGAAIYTGMGVGEHYVDQWDDRGLLVRGPVILGLKEEARQLLASQGFNEDEIPQALRPLPMPSDYEAKLAALRDAGWDATALQAHNHTGFAMKHANLVKATLYNLMPPGSHLYITDPLWNSPFWASMVASAALRGCWVLVVSPAEENAPSSSHPEMALSNQVFTRFVVFQNEMRAAIDAAGGLFRTGVYAVDLDIADVVETTRAFAHNVSQDGVFRKKFPFDPRVYELLASLPDTLLARGYHVSHLVQHDATKKPKPHLKTQFFASNEAIESLVPRPEWVAVVRDYTLARAEQTRVRADYPNVKKLQEAVAEDKRILIDEWHASLTEKERDRSIFYFSIGSQNQNSRSLIMDGEALIVLAGTRSMVSYLDFVLLLGLTTWVENVEQLDALLPEPSGFWSWVGRHLKNAF
jgi:hypothetical protein